MSIATERQLTYVEAVREALDLCLGTMPFVMVLGQGVNDHSASFGITKDLFQKYGDRIQDTPLSEAGMMGVCLGASILNTRIVFTHNRPDFLYLTMDQLFNHAAKYSYIFGGQLKMPFVVWSCIAGGWGTGGQHSQSNHSMFAHVPGLKVVMPSNAFDAKGLLVSSIEDNNPVIFLDHRWVLRNNKCHVPEGLYRVELGKGTILREGTDITIAGVSYMIAEAKKAADALQKDNVNAEVVDLRCLRPFDEDILISSVKKTGRLIAVDGGWPRFGVASEISAIVAEKCFEYLKSPIIRISSPDCPTPSSPVLEKIFYKSYTDIVASVREVMRK